MQGFPGLESFLEARISRTPANVARALADAGRNVDGSIPIANYLQALAEFGTTDDLISFLLQTAQRDQRGKYIGVLFRPPFRAFWHDPRSLQVAARYGLIDYWRGSGHWPDFCSWSDLPYDCKNEAAKVGG